MELADGDVINADGAAEHTAHVLASASSTGVPVKPMKLQTCHFILLGYYRWYSNKTRGQRAQRRPPAAGLKLVAEVDETRCLPHTREAHDHQVRIAAKRCGPTNRVADSRCA